MYKMEVSGIFKRENARVGQKSRFGGSAREGDRRTVVAEGFATVVLEEVSDLEEQQLQHEATRPLRLGLWNTDCGGEIVEVQGGHIVPSDDGIDGNKMSNLGRLTTVDMDSRLVSEQNTYADIEAAYKCLKVTYGVKEDVILYG
ncbi:hypothetical protein L1987_36205 [Smallanthus sonchifolius]|uniref:Uncharacterized protein n=1 Tax=Smallanthus sonchifolius TaxID=185202 RepID=A0ACB9HEA2_9ASTR|nr:hypothetical protein L1987_36205 [Smallanthus sonchifolius]